MPRLRSRAPAAIAAFTAIPLFFSALMAASLALEKPRVVQWTSGGHLKTTWHDPSSATEVRIWLWALVPPMLLVLAGFAASFVPYGFYVVCGAAIVDALAVTHRLDRWTAHHTARFPNGVDLIPASNPGSNKFDPGQWEGMAQSTSLSLEHWTIGIAVGAALVSVALVVRRRWFARRPPAPIPPTATTGGAPAITPLLELETADSDLVRGGRPGPSRSRPGR